MEFWRCFSWDGKSKNGQNPGAPLYVPFSLQGTGRYDIIDTDGIFYGAVEKESALAEYLKVFRGKTIGRKNFENSSGFIKALVLFRLKDENIVDLRNLKELDKHSILPAKVISQEREVTQSISRKIYEKKHDGFLYWSPLKSEWTNVALYYSRAAKKTEIESIIKVTIDMPELQQTGKLLGVQIEELT